MSEGLTFRRAERKDLPRISEFRKSCFPYNSSIRSCEPEYYEWRCYTSPLGEGDIWIGEDGDRVVGMQIWTPRRFKMSGRTVTGAKTGDSFTHPNYQRRGISTTLAKATKDSAVEKGASLLYTTPNRNALPVWRRAGYEQIPSVRFRSLIKPMCLKQLLKAKLPFAPLASILSPIIEIASRAIFVIGMRGTAKSNVLICHELSFPDDINTLWEQASKNYEIISVRTKDYLEWRYVTNPDTYSILIARNRDGIILGYMVTKIGFSGDILRGFLVDFLTIEDDPNIFKKLLATSIEEFYQRKVDVVSTYTVKGSFYDKILLRLGFFGYDTVSLLCYKNELGNQVIDKTYRWHFTNGDTDGV